MGDPDQASKPVSGLRAFEALLGDSLAMRRVRERIARIAQHDCQVLVTGETGTGKELAARMVHALSPRQAGPFVPVNCAALPEGLIEGELFGHERGAFTGASERTPGLLRAANSGSILLDEIGEMTPAAQAKLLRVVESEEIWQLGASRPLPLEVRIIAATNQDLEARVNDRGFRADLYFRLSIGRIEMPPLREHPEDVPLLIERFVSRLAGRLQRQTPRFAPDVLALAARYAWPGNVRELRNFVEATFINSDAKTFGLGDLPEPWASSLAACAAVLAGNERSRLIAALAASLGNRAEAARSLRCSRMTLYRRMKKHGLGLGR
jgi:DNA-binding NtrC family response regulator